MHLPHASLTSIPAPRAGGRTGRSAPSARPAPRADGRVLSRIDYFTSRREISDRISRSHDVCGPSIIVSRIPSATGVRRWPRPLNVRWDRFGPTSGDHWCSTCGYSCSLVGRCFAMLLRVQSATASICGGSPSHRAGGRKGGYPEVAQNLGLFKCPSYRGAHAGWPAGWLVRRILVPKIAPLSMK